VEILKRMGPLILVSNVSAVYIRNVRHHCLFLGTRRYLVKSEGYKIQN